MPKLIVRDEILQQVKPHGTYEVQAHFHIKDGMLFERLQAVSRGFLTNVRREGDLIEAYSLHDTRTGAEGTLREWKTIASE